MAEKLKVSAQTAAAASAKAKAAEAKAARLEVEAATQQAAFDEPLVARSLIDEHPRCPLAARNMQGQLPSVAPPALELPVDFPRHKCTAQPSVSEVPLRRVDAIVSRLAQRCDTDASCTAVAAWLVLLARHCGQSEISTAASFGADSPDKSITVCVDVSASFVSLLDQLSPDGLTSVKLETAASHTTQTRIAWREDTIEATTQASELELCLPSGTNNEQQTGFLRCVAHR